MKSMNEYGLHKRQLEKLAHIRDGLRICMLIFNAIVISYHGNTNHQIKSIPAPAPEFLLRTNECIVRVSIPNQSKTNSAPHLRTFRPSGRPPAHYQTSFQPSPTPVLVVPQIVPASLPTPQTIPVPPNPSQCWR